MSRTVGENQQFETVGGFTVRLLPEWCPANYQITVRELPERCPKGSGMGVREDRNNQFLLDGEYFSKLGEEYDIQNPIYTIRTFPENVYLPNSDKAFSSWTGGLLGVLEEQMKDYNKFHDDWYVEDMD